MLEKMSDDAEVTVYRKGFSGFRFNASGAPQCALYIFVHYGIIARQFNVNSCKEK